MGDGKSFDVETESPAELALRARYEKLVEIHQEKGNSECLSPFGHTDEDCGFELYLTRNSQPMTAGDFSEQEWEQARSSYVRRLLLRGLYGYQQSGARQLNPLQLGIVGFHRQPRWDRRFRGRRHVAGNGVRDGGFRTRDDARGAGIPAAWWRCGRNRTPVPVFSRR